MTAHIISNPKIISRVTKLHEELERQKITDFKLWPSIQVPHKPARFGISLAHKAIIEWALIEGLEKVMVFEDDIRFPAEDGFQYYLANEPKDDYDLYLGGVYRGDINEQGITKRFTGMHHYTIHERFYTAFLGVDENLDIDGAMSGLGKFYVCNPFASIQHNGFSQNCNGNMDYTHLLKGRKIYGLL
jgi:hypothetical protein